MILKFANYIDWPASSFETPTSEIIIGVIGDDPFEGNLEKITASFNTKGSIKGRKILIKRYKKVSEISICHILYISNSEKENLKELLQKLSGKKIVTIAEISNFCKQKGIINFVKNNAKFDFEINEKVFKSEDISISSQLLSKATIIN